MRTREYSLGLGTVQRMEERGLIKFSCFFLRVKAGMSGLGFMCFGVQGAWGDVDG